MAADSASAAAAIHAETGRPPRSRLDPCHHATQSKIAAALGFDDEAAALRDEARMVALDLEDVRTVRSL